MVAAAEETETMGYETKIILAAVADIIRTSETLDEALDRVARIAGAGGVAIAKHGMPEEPEAEPEHESLHRLRS